MSEETPDGVGSAPTVASEPKGEAEPAAASASAPPPLPQPKLEPGALVAGRFVVEGKLGEGGMGVVFRARDRILERPVAVKVLQADLGSDPAFMARFLHEARIIAGLSSNPHVVTLYDAGSRDGAPYMVMELLAGRTLRALLEAAGQARLSRTWVLEMGRHVTSALVDAHHKGVTHRDLKPENVFVIEARTLPFLVKVLDFGLAHSAGAPLPGPLATRPGALLGTPQYMAPEQVGGEAEPASDIYALGLLLYEAACGRLPFRGATSHEWMRAHLTHTPAPLPRPAHGPGYPAGFARLVAAMLEKSARARPRAGEVIRELAVLERAIDDAERAASSRISASRRRAIRKVVPVAKKKQARARTRAKAKASTKTKAKAKTRR